MSTPEQEVRKALGLDEPDPLQRVRDAEPPGVMEKLARGVQAISSIVNPISTGPQSLESLGEELGLLSGAIEGAVVHPAASIAELVGADDLARKWRAKDRGVGGYIRNTATALGATEEDLAVTEAAGQFVGFTVPLLGSMKVASLIPGIPKLTQLTPRLGSVARDFVAGGIYGFTFVPGETVEERLHNATHEAAVFAGFSLLASTGHSLLALRRQRLWSKSKTLQAFEDLGLLRTGRDAETGLAYIELLDRETAKKLAELGNEEFYISTSKAAQNILTKQAELEAVITGVKEHAGSEGTRFIVRGVKTPFIEIRERVKKLFPSLNVERVSREDGTIDLIIGAKPLSSSGKHQVKLYHYWPGQKVSYNGSEGYTFVKGAEYAKNVIPASDEQFVYILDQFGGRHRVKLKNIKGKDYGIGENMDDELKTLIRNSPELAGLEADNTELLFREFWQWFESKIEQVSKARAPMTEAEFIKGVTSGEIRIDPVSGRYIQTGAEFAYPEQVGIRTTPEEGAAAIESVKREGIESVRLLLPDEPGTFEDLVMQFLTERGLSDKLDANVFQAWAAQKVRARLIGSLPVEERMLLNNITKEFINTVEAAGHSTSDLGALAGYKVTISQDGRYFARHVSTGQVYKFANEETASEFFRAKTVEEATDFAASSKIPIELPVNSATSHLPKRDGIIGIDELSTLTDIDSIVPVSVWRSVRDFFLKIETQSKGVLKLFTQGYAPVDEGLQAMRLKLIPEIEATAKSWRGSGWRRRAAVGRWISDAFKEGALTDAELLKVANRYQLSPSEKAKGINYVRTIHSAFGEIGTDGRQMLSIWYKNIQPEIEAGKDLNSIIKNLPDILKDDRRVRLWRSFLKYASTGELSQAELDPLMIQVKWLRALRFDQHVYEPWEAFRQVLQSGTLGLNEEQVANVARQLGETGQFGHIAPESRYQLLLDQVLGGAKGRELVSNTGTEFLNNLRGFPNEQNKALKRMTQKIFKRAGITTDDRVLEDLLHTYMSIQYGAAMGLRPMLVTRNLTQNFWTSYVRLGPRYAGYAFERAMTLEGFKEAEAALAIRSAAKATAAGDVAFDNMMSSMPWATGSGPASDVGASITRFVLRTGRVGRKVAEKSLIPYTNADDVNRVIAYFWQKKHTLEALNKFGGKGNILDNPNTRELFMKEGLPHYDRPIQEEFMRRLERFGQEDALKWIGKQAADEAHFIYGAASQPLWMQNPLGRLAGMFGTWPIWYRQYMARMFMNGTAAQRAGAIVRMGIVGGAVGVTAHELGVDIWSWMAPTTPISYFGGPPVEMVYNVKQIAEADMGKKPAAIWRFIQNGGRLSFPGQTLFRDLKLGLQQAADPAQAAIFIGVGRPELTPITMKDWIYDTSWFDNPQPPQGLIQDRLLSLPPLGNLTEQ